MKVGIVSGYFNPIHMGHIEYINGAKEQCDFLIAIINNDRQVTLKGTLPFMTADHRQFIVSELRSVDWTIISQDDDTTVCKTIKYINYFYPNNLTFFNSGDRIGTNINNAEENLCKSLNINFQLLDLPKRYSSSKILYETIDQS